MPEVLTHSVLSDFHRMLGLEPRAVTSLSGVAWRRGLPSGGLDVGSRRVEDAGSAGRRGVEGHAADGKFAVGSSILPSDGRHHPEEAS